MGDSTPPLSLTHQSPVNPLAAAGAPILCGRGDKRTKKGKRFKGSHGNSRLKKEKMIERLIDKADVPRNREVVSGSKLEVNEEKKVSAVLVAATVAGGGDLGAAEGGAPCVSEQGKQRRLGQVHKACTKLMQEKNSVITNGEDKLCGNATGKRLLFSSHGTKRICAPIPI